MVRLVKSVTDWCKLDTNMLRWIGVPPNVQASGECLKYVPGRLRVMAARCKMITFDGSEHRTKKSYVPKTTARGYHTTADAKVKGSARELWTESSTDFGWRRTLACYEGIGATSWLPRYAIVDDCLRYHYTVLLASGRLSMQLPIFTSYWCTHSTFCSNAVVHCQHQSHWCKLWHLGRLMMEQ